MTYREALERAADRLDSAEIEYSDTESRLLMEYICQADFGFYLLHADEEMPETLEEAYRRLVRERSTHRPLQQLTGVQEFMGIPITVNEGVLIPRQDTEILAEEAIRILRDRDRDRDRLPGTGTADRAPRVLDLCTGSGCIAVAVKSFCPDARVCGSDISEKALETARTNACVNNLKIQWIKSDLFSEIDGLFDLIVSNPPYIPAGVIDTLKPEVRDHEPRTALDGGADGLDFYRKIIADCGTGPDAAGSFHKMTDRPGLHSGTSRLKQGGYLLLEIGSEQAENVRTLMEQYRFEDVRVIRDLAGLDRVMEGRLRI